LNKKLVFLIAFETRHFLILPTSNFSNYRINRIIVNLVVFFDYYY